MLIKRLDIFEEAPAVEGTAGTRLELFNGSAIVGVMHTLDVFLVILTSKLGSDGSLETNEGASARMKGCLLPVVCATGQNPANLGLHQGCPS